MRAFLALLYVVGAARALAPFAGPRALLAELVAHAGPSPARLPSEGTGGRIRRPSAGGGALDRLSKFTGSLTNLFAERPSAGR